MTKIGNYTFKTDLIKTALTHSSFSSKNYERLEFLGDSILDFLIADILYKNSKYKEDQLTRARAFVVSEENLSQIFDKLNISPMVKLGKSCKEITKAIKCDIVESIVACIYLESGLKACNLFIIENFDINAKEQKDYKTQFQEFAQQNKLEFHYSQEKTTGPAHNLTFYVNLTVNNEVVSRASGKSKSDAEKECAKIALNKLLSRKD